MSDDRPVFVVTDEMVERAYKVSEKYPWDENAPVEGDRRVSGICKLIIREMLEAAAGRSIVDD